MRDWKPRKKYVKNAKGRIVEVKRVRKVGKLNSRGRVAIHLWVDVKVKERWLREADRAGETLSEWIRKCADRSNNSNDAVASLLQAHGTRRIPPIGERDTTFRRWSGDGSNDG